MASHKVDNRNPFGPKRSRNDTSHNDGDWTCPQCGNVNFGFRTVCNRTKCAAPRPQTPPRFGASPMPGAYGHPPFYIGGVGAPPQSSFGMSTNYPPPLPLPGMHYDYRTPGSATSPYGGVPPYALTGLFRGYGPGPATNTGYGYGPYGFRGSPLPGPGQWFGVPSENNGSRKRRGGPDDAFEGDWVCPKCENVNFSFRTSCNMKKCGAPRPSSPGPNRSGAQDSSAPEGSWTCSKCNNLNYPFRTVCNRKGCGAEKPGDNN